MNGEMADRCVGFADCPCRRCRRTRVEMTERHGQHTHISERSYCGVCRTEETNRYYRAPGAAR